MVTRLGLQRFRELLSGKSREKALSPDAKLDYLLVDARRDAERDATGAARLEDLGDVRLRVAVVRLAAEHCLDGSGDAARVGRAAPAVDRHARRRRRGGRIGCGSARNRLTLTVAATKR